MNCMCVILYIYMHVWCVSYNTVSPCSYSYVHILVILCICEQVLEALTVVEPQ